ncbi:MAG: DUF547 domain-containing protein [Deltaproteobacteria bacterium]|nr:MAG: DUF547 domain-containing protein [Deltaproteobacteria bacterium]
MADSWIRNLRDAGDILKRARSPVELAKALVPNQWLARKVLNDEAPAASSASPTEIAQALRKLRNQLKTEALDEDGQVDYAKLRSSPTFAEMKRTSGLLQAIDPGEMTDDATRTAFWINLYNVLAIHGVLALGIRASVMEVPSFFGVVAYRVGDLVLTLDEIENGVLRRNAPHPATSSRLFDDDDPRLALCPSYVDPRIHAALVCASTSCPPVAFYEASKLDAQLELAALNYVATDVEVDDANRVVRIPITFRYYESDFGRAAGVRLFLIEHAQGAQREALEAAFEDGYELDYHRYDWSLNSMA